MHVNTNTQSASIWYNRRKFIKFNLVYPYLGELHGTKTPIRFMCPTSVQSVSILMYWLKLKDTSTSGWTIRPTFDQSSVSWYNRVWSLTTSRNRLNLPLPYVSQYPHILLYLRQFPKLSFNKLIDLSWILGLFTTTDIFTGSGCFW